MSAAKADDRLSVISNRQDDAQANAPRTPPIVESTSLFGSKTEILIAHAGAYYRLKITRQGKLILTK